MMDTRQVLAVVLLVVLAGCAAGTGTPTAADTPAPTASETPTATSTPSPTASPTPTTSPTPSPVPRPGNPWGKERVVIGLDAPDGERDYAALIREGMAFWTAQRVATHGNYPVEFVVRPDADDPDIVIEVIPSISTCGYQVTVGGWLGCAPILQADSDPGEPTLVEISADQTNTEFVNTVAHEFGHVLGQDHDGTPTWLMTHGNGTNVVAPDAVDRPNPWNDTDDIEVYVRPGFKDDAAVERDVRAAVDYYDRHPEYLPPGVSIRMVDHWYDADIIFQNRSAPGFYEVYVTPGTAPYEFGLDWDRDYAWEWYTVVYIYVEQPDGLDMERHAGYWIGVYMNVEKDDLPDRFK